MLRFAWLRRTPSPRPLPLRGGEGARRAGEGATRITISLNLLAYAVLSHALDAAHQRPEARPAQSLAVSAQSCAAALHHRADWPRVRPFLERRRPGPDQARGRGRGRLRLEQSAAWRDEPGRF